MTNISSYLDYLPSVLWSQENDPTQFLGRMLSVFEKILTGIPDEISIVHYMKNCYEKDYHEHDDFEKTIDELNQIFNPWKTNEDFLPWLASWVSLTLQKDWSEYQKRKLILEMVSIYQERGLKKGLHDYLDIYAATEAKIRIAIDNGDSILRVRFLDSGDAVLHSVAHRMKFYGQTVLLHPSAIAADNDNNYIVADQGDPFLSPPQPTIWRVSSKGDIDYISNSQIPPIPHPFYSGKLVKPTAVVVDKLNRYSVVDAGEFTDPLNPNSAIYRFDPKNPDNPLETVFDKSNKSFSPPVYPVDMILDGSENFIVLDRGTYPPGEFLPYQPASSGQKIVEITKEHAIEGSLAVVEHRLKKVVEPTALVMDSVGRFIIADAKNQSPSDPADSIPADLVMVDRNAEWSETPLLDGIKNNPLIFPTGLAFEDPQTLLVCDTGVRLGFIDTENNRTMAKPAAIYRIKNLPHTQPSQNSREAPIITRVTYDRKLVNPTKMMIDRKGNLIITDKGESKRANENGPDRDRRAKANEFGVEVLFSQQPNTFESFVYRSKILGEIETIINEHKPVHASWWMKYE